MIILSIVLFLIGTYILLSYKFEWEHSKKEWQKGKPYSKYDKILGSIFAFMMLIVAIYFFIKAL